MKIYTLQSRLKLLLFVCLSLAILLPSCAKYDFEDLDVNYDGEWALPLIKSKWTFEDIAGKDQDAIKYADDGLIQLYYSGMNMSAINAQDFLYIPSQNFTNTLPVVLPPMTAGTQMPEISIPFDFDFILEDQSQVINSIVFKNGELEIAPTFNQEPSIKLNVKLICENLYETDGVTPVTKNIIIGRSNRIGLAGKILVLSDATSNNKIKFKIVFSTDRLSQDFEGGQYEFNNVINLTDLDFKRMDGYLGNLTINYVDTLQISLFDKTFSGKIDLESFKAQVAIRNSFGVAVGFNEQYFKALAIGLKPQVLITDMPKSFIVNGASNPGNVTKSVVDISSPQLVSAINNLYERFAVDYMISTNPGVTSASNFIYDTSKINVDMNFEIPLSGTIENIKFADTIAFSMPDIDILQKLVINSVIINNFPIDVDFQIYFLDEYRKFIRYDNGEIAKLFQTSESLIKAAPVGSDFKVLTPMKSNVNADIDYETVQKLSQCKFLLLEAVINSKNSTLGNGKVKIFNTGYIDASIGVKIKADLSSGK